MVSISAYGRQHRITIPLELVRMRGWRKGTRLRFVEDVQGNILLKEVEPHGSR